MMTSKECVIRAIEKSYPDWTPAWLELVDDDYNLPIVKDIKKDYTTDMIMVRCKDPDFTPIGEGYHWMGYKNESFGETMGEVKNPPLEDWGVFDKWKAALPDFSKEKCYEAVKRIREENPDKFIVGGLNLMMEEIINLRGYANYMIDFYDEEENLEALIDVLYDIGYKMVDGYAAAGMDAVIAWEDWGLQNSPMISYDLWKKFFYKKMKAFVDHIHSKGMKYILHSCGHIIYLLDAFADIGIDVLQLDQQKNMGIDELQKWKDKFCFCCPVDIQYSVNMPENEMRDYFYELKNKLGSEKGGFIYKPYMQPAAIHMTEKQLRMEIELAQGLR